MRSWCIGFSPVVYRLSSGIALVLSSYNALLFCKELIIKRKPAAVITISVIRPTVVVWVGHIRGSCLCRTVWEWLRCHWHRCVVRLVLH